MAQPSEKQSSQKNPYENFFKNFSLPHFDMEAAMQMHRKNLEVFTKAHKAALATAKEVSQLHGQYTKKMMEDIKSHIQNVRNTSSREDKMKAHAQSMKNGMDKAVNHGRDVMNMWSKTNKEISENFSKRFKEGVDEAKHLVKKKAANK
jgi:phasin family protein